MADKIKVALVDDSPFMLEVIRKLINADPGLSLEGAYTSGKELLKNIKIIKPQVLILDYNMPEMDGIETLRRVMKAMPTSTIFLTGHIEKGTDEALQAYEAGALAIIEKPGEGEVTLKQVGERLSREVRAASTANPTKIKSFIKDALKSVLTRQRVKTKFTLVVIGASAGGSIVLEKLIAGLPSDFYGAVVIAQHIPEHIARTLTYSLTRVSKLLVADAQDGEILKAGRVYIAPSGKNLLIEQQAEGFGALSLLESGSYSGPAPSIDMLFESAARVYGDKALAVILSGNGRDGLVGAKMIKEYGGQVFVQNPKTAQATGLPTEIIKHNLSDKILTPDELVAKIIQAVRPR